MLRSLRCYYNKGVAISPKTLVLLPLPGMSTMCTVYSFPREGVVQQNVYNVYSLQFSTEGGR